MVVVLHRYIIILNYSFTIKIERIKQESKITTTTTTAKEIQK